MKMTLKNIKKNKKVIYISTAIIILLLIFGVVLGGFLTQSEDMIFKGSKFKIKKSKEQKETFVVVTNSVPSDFDFILEEGYGDNFIKENVFESLIEINSDNTIKNEVAQSVKFDKSGLKATIKIKDRKFTDNTKLTVDDIIKSYENINKNPKGYKYQQNSMYIKGVSNYQDGKSDKISGLKKVDDKILEVEFVKPLSSNMRALDIPIYKEGTDNSTNKGSALQGTGEYYIESMDLGNSIKLKRKESTNKNENPYKNIFINNANMEKIDDKLKSFEIDMYMLDDSGEIFEKFKKAGWHNIYKIKDNNISYVKFNKESSIYKDTEKKKFIAKALDSKEFIKNLEKGSNVSDGVFTSKSSKNSFNNVNKKVNKNLKKQANKLGFDEKNPVKLSYGNDTYTQAIGVEIERQLKEKHIPVELTLNGEYDFYYDFEFDEYVEYNFLDEISDKNDYYDYIKKEYKNNPYDIFLASEKYASDNIVMIPIDCGDSVIAVSADCKISDEMIEKLI